MSKLKWIFCISLVSVCLLAACGAVRNRIVLPDAGDVEKVTVTGGGISLAVEDAGEITELLQRMGRVRDTGGMSIHDRPLAEDVLQIDFEFSQGGTSVVFLYQERGKTLLEQPYQGIYRVDTEVLDDLLEQGETG